MYTIAKLIGPVLFGAAALALAGCATGLRTQVSRYQSMPAPAGQTFYVIPAEGQPRNNQFNRYAVLVAQQLAAKGYSPAGAPQVANMLVKLDYGVDDGKTEYRLDPFAYGYGGYDAFYGYFGRPYWTSSGYWGHRSRYYHGWHDPFWGGALYAGYGSGFGDPIRSHTVYKTFLDLDIVQRSDNAALFEGHAMARSQTDELDVLLPNLVEALFTGFPGRSGETVKITVPARRK